LRDEAVRRGVNPAHLYFTGHVQTQEHLDRLRHTDLILDTHPYGGHTLTSDALWAGTPVVTLCGETFASRVAASLLTDVGMDELVTYSEQAYLDKAESLLCEPRLLLQWRRHLDEGRERFALFDAGLYARRFERLMWETVKKHWT
jgi:protein O-GlcNAc transferase